MDIQSLVDALKKLEYPGDDVLVGIVIYSNGGGYLTFDGDEGAAFERVEDIPKALEAAQKEYDEFWDDTAIGRNGR